MAATILHVAETGSTNSDLAALARDGAPEGTWLSAGCQNAGRGRLGRDWVSPPGNLHASTLVRLRPGDPPAPTLALVAAVALEEVVAAWLPAGHVELKWPNDLLVGARKLSGILLERSDDAVVIGIGVNLAHHPDLFERPATSLAAEGVSVSPDQFLGDLAPALARWLGRWRGEGIAPVRARWIARAHPQGTPLVARSDGDAVTGLFDGLEADGALRLRLADGSARVIHAADVAAAGA